VKNTLEHGGSAWDNLFYIEVSTMLHKYASMSLVLDLELILLSFAAWLIHSFPSGNCVNGVTEF
jgi:hypothetical protein